MTQGDREALVRAVRTALEQTHAEYALMPFFVRPMVRRGFAKRTGHDLAGWQRMLDAVARGEPTAELRAALDRLAAHYDTAPERAKRGMGAGLAARPDELREVERPSQDRAAAVRALARSLR
ncbi:MAG TPA: hypothetical protein VFP84_34085 [Kofleriaceae bacterium]|nr:hypothetical protein [Kofleriaceae bacterium]